VTSDDQPTTWAIRLTAKAYASLEAAWRHLARTAGEEIADAWREGLEEEISRLARMPGSLPLARENDRFAETVRSLLYRRTPRGPAHRILFVQRSSELEAPTVVVINIRHGAQAPITRREARELEQELEGPE
jgi:plasmid stabilization system protein ParE